MNPKLSKVSRSSVLKSINDFDKKGIERSLNELGFKNSTHYLLKYNNILYPSKAVIGHAYNLQFPTHVKTNHINISGGINKGHAAYCLIKLGFTIVDNQGKNITLMSSSNEITDNMSSETININNLDNEYWKEKDKLVIIFALIVLAFGILSIVTSIF